MAVLWVHAVSVLVLLVTSCEGFQPVEGQRLCGSHLVDALYLVCGPNGFHYTPASGGSLRQSFLPLKADRAAPDDQMMVRPDVVQRCCLNSCNIFDLLEYCLPA